MRWSNASNASSIGNGFAEGTEMGPVQSAFQRQKILNMIQAGVQEGAVLRCGGKSAGGRRLRKPRLLAGADRARQRAQRHEDRHRRNLRPGADR
ncbi:aldehyde dehydrogenase family protein [Cupriavidus basilensis]